MQGGIAKRSLLLNRTLLLRAIADIVFAAIGIDDIPAIAPVVADGLSRRLHHARPPLRQLPQHQNTPSAGRTLARYSLEYSFATARVTRS